MLVSVGDIRLFVDVDGAKFVPDGDSMRERPTIVMLHGNGADHSPFKEFFAAFSDFAQVVYYDLRGHGRSDDGEPDRWNLDQWADDLVALCDALGIEQPVVFGFSFGGNITLNYAIRNPDRPAKIIVVSCAARINPDASIRMYERLGGPDVAAVAEQVLRRARGHMGRVSARVQSLLQPGTPSSRAWCAHRVAAPSRHRTLPSPRIPAARLPGPRRGDSLPDTASRRGT